MADIVVETTSRPVMVSMQGKGSIDTIEQVHMVSTESTTGVLNVETVNKNVTVEAVAPAMMTVIASTSVVSINNSFNAGNVEILVKDIIAANPAILGGNNAAKIEYLMVNRDLSNGKYYVVTSAEIEGDLLTMLIEYGDEQLEVVGSMNIVNKSKVEFTSDIDVYGKMARVTYIKKV